MKNKKIFQKWIDFAKVDLKDAQILFEKELNPYYNLIRYPDVVLTTPLKYDKKTTQKLLLRTKEISKWLLLQLNQKK